MTSVYRIIEKGRLFGDKVQFRVAGLDLRVSE